MPKKIQLVSFSDVRGGAAQAALRLVSSLKKSQADCTVDYIVAEKKNTSLFSYGPTYLLERLHLLFRVMTLFIQKLQRSSNPAKHSLNLFSSKHVVNSLDPAADVIHLHWINNESLSIGQISHFLQSYKGSFVMTMHDDWLFAGAEHYVKQGSQRYIDGYTKSNADVGGLDLDRWTFNRKGQLARLLEQENVVLTAPSSSLQKKAQSSYLLKKCDIRVVANIINPQEFSPLDKAPAKKFFDFSEESLVIAFGAVDGAGNFLKGYDLLTEALQNLSQEDMNSKVELLVFGGTRVGRGELCGFQVNYLGHVNGYEELSRVYSAADVTLVPSRIEAFGQVAAESLACETPVIAFNNSGLTDIVQHEVSGYLVEAFDTKALSARMRDILSMSSVERSSMGQAGRQHVIEKFSPEVVIRQWEDIYFGSHTPSSDAVAK
jgi:glycosyltransferase involved in cell wall biosynthesis